MADLTDAQSALTTKIVGADSTGIETNFLSVDANNNLGVVVKDASDVSITSTLVSGKQRLDVSLASSGVPGASVPVHTLATAGKDGSGNLGTIRVDTSGNQYSNTLDGAGNSIDSTTYNGTRGLKVIIPQIGASTSSYTRVTLPTGNTAQQVLAANALRKWVYIINNSGATVTLGLGFGPSAGGTLTANQGVVVTNGTTFMIDMTNLWLGTIDAVFPSNNRTLDVVEGS